MMNKRRLISLGLAAILTVTVMAGCAGKTAAGAGDGNKNANGAPSAEAPKKNITLKMWGGVPPEAGPQEMADNFNKEFASKGIKIEYERFVNDDQGNLKLDTNLLAGSDIDLYITYSPDVLKKRAQGNMAMDITDMLKKGNIDIKAQFGEAAALLSIDGKYYAMPTTKGNGHALLINKKMFDDAGIPVPTAWTFDEFRDVAKKLTKGEGQSKVYGFYSNSAQAITFANDFISASIGNDAMFKPGSGFKETNYDNPVFEKAYQNAVDMMLVDKSSVSHVDGVTQKLTIESVFLAEKAAMSVGPWIVRSIKDREKFPHKFQTAFVPFPVMDKSKYYPPVNVGDLLSINPKSKNINEAWEFVKWYTDGGIMPMAKYGRIPGSSVINPDNITKAILDGADDLLDAKTYKSTLLEHPKTIALTTYLAPPEIAKMQKEEIEAMFTGKKPVSQALSDLKKRADDFLKTVK